MYAEEQFFQQDEMSNCSCNTPKMIKPKFFKELNMKHQMKFKHKQKRKMASKKHMLNMVMNSFISYELGLVDGNGQSVSMNNHTIKGNFVEGQLSGDAEVTYEHGTHFIGKFSRGQKVAGIMSFTTGHVYKGTFQKNQFSGEGQLIYPNGNKIKGQWMNSHPIGKVIIEYASGVVYYGYVKNYKKHGEGYLFLNNNKKYIGQFEDGQICGHGAYYANDKLIAEGIWQNSKLVTPNTTKEFESRKSLKVLNSDKNITLERVLKADIEDRQFNHQLKKIRLRTQKYKKSMTTQLVYTNQKEINYQTNQTEQSLFMNLVKQKKHRKSVF